MRLWRKSVKPRYNTALNGAFQDEMSYDYIKLIDLDVPQCIRRLITPKKPCISPDGNRIKRFTSSREYVLIGTTNFHSVQRTPLEGLQDLPIDTIENYPGMNIYTGMSIIESCRYAVTRDGRIFMSKQLMEQVPNSKSSDTLLPVLRRMGLAFNSRFSHTGKIRHLKQLTESLEEHESAQRSSSVSA